MASKRRQKEHPCFAKADAALRKRGDCLQRVVSLSGGPRCVYIATERVESTNWKRGSSWLAASFCPFCGESLDEKAITEEKKR